MNLGHALFGVNGRSGQQDFWIGVLIIVGGNIVAGFIPVLGILIWLALIWVGVAVYGKRLHDAGKSAWLHVIPWALGIVLFIIGISMIVAAGLSAGILSDGGDLSDEQIFALISGSVAGVAIMSASSLVWLIYTIWVGVIKSDPEPNVYGPVPSASIPPTSPPSSTGAGPGVG